MNAKQASVNIELLYLDLDICARCRETDGNLDTAIEQVRAELEEMGNAVQLMRHHVTTETEALALGLEISPTIRVNGRDTQLDWQANRCGECTDLAGGQEEVACRIWNWQGEEYFAAPVEMIVAAIRKAAAEPPAADGLTLPKQGQLSENLRRFFAGPRPSGSCCG
jgi:hypothetical protein